MDNVFASVRCAGWHSVIALLFFVLLCVVFSFLVFRIRRLSSNLVMCIDRKSMAKHKFILKVFFG